MLAPTAATVSANGLCNGNHIELRIADESDLSSVGGSSRPTGDLCLLKVFSSANHMLCAYWVRKGTTVSVASMMWKYWRQQFSGNSMPTIKDRSI